MKKTTILSVMAVLWPYASKEKGAERLKPKAESSGCEEQGLRNKEQGAKNKGFNVESSGCKEQGVESINLKVERLKLLHGKTGTVWASKRSVYLLMIILFFGLVTIAQAQETKVKDFRVGEKLPEHFWKQEHVLYKNGQTHKTTLADHKGKLLILDFWATWCGSCLKQFPHLDSLQNQFPDELAIVMVNNLVSDSNAGHVKKTFDLHAKDSSLRTIVNDTYLGSAFPHWVLPHSVWIGANGSVIAFTGPRFVNATTIEKLLGANSGKGAKL